MIGQCYHSRFKLSFICLVPENEIFLKFHIFNKENQLQLPTPVTSILDCHRQQQA
jgi:hypothetical protein